MTEDQRYYTFVMGDFKYKVEGQSYEIENVVGMYELRDNKKSKRGKDMVHTWNNQPILNDLKSNTINRGLNAQQKVM